MKNKMISLLTITTIALLGTISTASANSSGCQGMNMPSTTCGGGCNNMMYEPVSRCDRCGSNYDPMENYPNQNYPQMNSCGCSGM